MDGHGDLNGVIGTDVGSALGPRTGGSALDGHGTDAGSALDPRTGGGALDGHGDLNGGIGADVGSALDPTIHARNDRAMATFNDGRKHT